MTEHHIHRFGVLEEWIHCNDCPCYGVWRKNHSRVGCITAREDWVDTKHSKLVDEPEFFFLRLKDGIIDEPKPKNEIREGYRKII